VACNSVTLLSSLKTEQTDIGGVKQITLFDTKLKSGANMSLLKHNHLKCLHLSHYKAKTGLLERNCKIAPANRLDKSANLTQFRFYNITIKSTGILILVIYDGREDRCSLDKEKQ